MARLQGLCWKAGISALCDPHASKPWDLVPVLGQSRRKAGIQSLQKKSAEIHGIYDVLSETLRGFLGATRV